MLYRVHLAINGFGLATSVVRPPKYDILFLTITYHYRKSSLPTVNENGCYSETIIEPYEHEGIEFLHGDSNNYYIFDNRLKCLYTGFCC